MTETYNEKKERRLCGLRDAWKQYLQIGAVLAVFGAIGLWIWFMTLWGPWGLFLGWIPAGLLGWGVLRFIWLPVLLAGLFLLLYALPTEMQVVAFKTFTLGGLLYFLIQYYSKKAPLRNKKGEQGNEG